MNFGMLLGFSLLLTSHCRWGGMFRIWIFLLLQRQSPGLGSAGTPQQEGKSFLGSRQQLARACRSIPLPHAELE